jgi:tetratricopeptide (TPR) repeat protein
MVIFISLVRAVIKERKMAKKDIKIVDKTIEQTPDDAVAWYKKGRSLSLLGRGEEAFKAYEKAIELKPDYVEALESKSSYLFFDGKELIHESCPTSLKRIKNLDKYARGLNMMEEANKICDKLAELKPGSVEPLQKKAEIIEDQIIFLKVDNELYNEKLLSDKMEERS